MNSYCDNQVFVIVSHQMDRYLEEMTEGHGGARPGAGRHPEFGKVPLRPCGFRALPAEQAAWKKAAKDSGKSYNTWVRETLNQAAKH